MREMWLLGRAFANDQGQIQDLGESFPARRDRCRDQVISPTCGLHRLWSTQWCEPRRKSRGICDLIWKEYSFLPAYLVYKTRGELPGSPAKLAEGN